MESVKLFYCIKRCDETDCFNKHIRKIHKIQDHIVECFKAHVVRDKLFNYVFWHEATVSEATHIQYLDSDGFIRIASLNSKDTLPGSKVINFRLLSISPGFDRFANVKPFELCPGAKFSLKAHANHLIK